MLAPAEAAVEAVTARWLLDLFGLPATASVGFVAGCAAANFTSNWSTTDADVDASLAALKRVVVSAAMAG